MNTSKLSAISAVFAQKFESNRKTSLYINLCLTQQILVLGKLTLKDCAELLGIKKLVSPQAKSQSAQQKIEYNKANSLQKSASELAKILSLPVKNEALFSEVKTALLAMDFADENVNVDIFGALAFGAGFYLANSSDYKEFLLSMMDQPIVSENPSTEQAEQAEQAEHGGSEHTDPAQGADDKTVQKALLDNSFSDVIIKALQSVASETDPQKVSVALATLWQADRLALIAQTNRAEEMAEKAAEALKRKAELLNRIKTDAAKAKAKAAAKAKAKAEAERIAKDKADSEADINNKALAIALKQAQAQQAAA